jgi:hypothetical protein
MDFSSVFMKLLYLGVNSMGSRNVKSQVVESLIKSLVRFYTTRLHRSIKDQKLKEQREQFKVQRSKLKGQKQNQKSGVRDRRSDDSKNQTTDDRGQRQEAKVQFSVVREKSGHALLLWEPKLVPNQGT